MNAARPHVQRDLHFKKPCTHERMPKNYVHKVGFLASSLAILSICNLVISRFGFEGGVLFLIAPVPVDCLLVTFILNHILSINGPSCAVTSTPSPLM